MHQLSSSNLAAISAILVAIIAGSFSFLNLVISKEQKVSEFRQGWIDSLREDISKYCAAAVFLSYAYDILEKEALDKLSSIDYLKAIEQQAAIATGTYTSIVLRLNPDDMNRRLRVLNIEFLDTLDMSREALRADEFEKAKLLCDVLKHKARPILKIEWDRVRDGEPFFRFARWFAFSIVLSALAAGLYFYRFYDAIN